MNKKEFLKALQKRTNDSDIVKYYDELISDRVEAGEQEDQVVASIGEIDVQNIKQEQEISITKEKNGWSKLAYQSGKALKSMFLPFNNKTFRIIYFSLFFITIPLTISFFAIIFSLFVTVLSMVLSLAITFASIVFSFAACALSCIIASPCAIIMGLIDFKTSFALGFTHIGGGIALFGLAVLFYGLTKFLFRIMFLRKKTKQQTNKKLWKTLYIIAPITILIGGIMFVIALYSVDWDITRFKDAFDVIDWFNRNFKH